MPIFLCPYLKKNHLLLEFSASATDISLVTCDKSMKTGSFELRTVMNNLKMFLFLSPVCLSKE